MSEVVEQEQENIQPVKIDVDGKEVEMTFDQASVYIEQQKVNIEIARVEIDRATVLINSLSACNYNEATMGLSDQSLGRIFNENEQKKIKAKYFDIISRF